MPDLDPRLVDLYDIDNPPGPDHVFYRDLARRLGARAILDLGCGTGQLTVSLRAAGREVIGVDPSATMLDRARSRPGAADVRWVHGDSSVITQRGMDLVLMSGNIPQHIHDPAWEVTLRDLRRCLRPDGVLAFETRNPAAREWESWQSLEPTVRETPHGPLQEWTEVEDLGEGIIGATFHNRFLRADQTVSVHEQFVFRDEATLGRDLHEAGFEVSETLGSWAGDPVESRSPRLVFVARAVRRP